MFDKTFLTGYFRSSEKPPENWKIGLEQELLGFNPDTGRRVTYQDTVQPILQGFVDRFGWEPYLEKGQIIGAKKGGSSITIEPGAQLELSCRPLASIGEIAQELGQYRAELAELSQDHRVIWVSMGYDPLSRVEDIAFVPKERYRIMGEYLPPLGEGAHHMMKATCTAQSNLDYGSEADMAAKMRTCTAFSPLVNLLFSSSPLRHGRPSGYKSSRSWAWRHFDPSRCGFLDFVFDPGFGYQAYADYAQGVPMFLVERHHEMQDLRGMDFRRFIEEGAEGIAPETEDWKLHLGVSFPAARLRNAIETRTCDAGPVAMILAQAAFWKGLNYDAQALQASQALIAARGAGYFKGLYNQFYHLGWSALQPGDDTDQLVSQVLELSRQGLLRQDQAQGNQDARFLEPLLELASRRESISDQLLKAYQSSHKDSIFKLLKDHQLIFA